MRAVKAKYIRRKATTAHSQASPRRSSSLLKPDWILGGMGKSSTSVAYGRELARPKGTWKEYWTRVIRNISEDNRLPRGFKEPASIFLDIDAKRPVAMGFRRR